LQQKNALLPMKITRKEPSEPNQAEQIKLAKPDWQHKTKPDAKLNKGAKLWPSKLPPKGGNMEIILVNTNG
jgi:hypothetical protein